MMDRRPPFHTVVGSAMAERRKARSHAAEPAAAQRFRHVLWCETVAETVVSCCLHTHFQQSHQTSSERCAGA
jgi:hypothetical protein